MEENQILGVVIVRGAVAYGGHIKAGVQIELHKRCLHTLTAGTLKPR